MELESLKQKILEMLPSSTIDEHDKTMLKILVPSMKQEPLEKIYKAFIDEAQKMAQLNEKQKRLEMKYQIMTDKISGGAPKL